MRRAYFVAVVLMGLTMTGCGQRQQDSGSQPSGTLPGGQASSQPSGQTDAGVALGSDFTLSKGKKATVAGQDVTVSFDQISDDSRCPPGKQCVWEGDATVHVTLTKAAQPTPIELHTSKRFATTADAAGMRVTLVSLNQTGDALTLSVQAI